MPSSPGDRARAALQSLQQSRGQRPTLPLDLAFKSRYVSHELQSLDIRIFVHLVWRLKSQKLAAVLAAPEILAELEVTTEACADFNDRWLTIYRALDKGRSIWAIVFEYGMHLACFAFWTLI